MKSKEQKQYYLMHKNIHENNMNDILKLDNNTMKHCMKSLKEKLYSPEVQHINNGINQLKRENMQKLIKKYDFNLKSNFKK